MEGLDQGMKLSKKNDDVNHDGSQNQDQANLNSKKV